MFVFISEFLESSALVTWLKYIEKQDVHVIVTNKNYNKILEGIVDKETDFVKYLGKGNIFVMDDASSGKLADSLRAKGEFVFGGSEISDRLENERIYGQKAMAESGISTVKSVNFKGNDALSKAIDFIKKNPKRWVIKQNGDAPKSISSVGKFDNGIDIIDKLDDMKHTWTENIDFDLQEFIDGHEIGVSAWFNGWDFVRDKKGEIVYELNWQHKKKSPRDLGVTTGEVGTLAYRSTKNSKIAKEMYKIFPLLKRIKYIGNVDIGFMISKVDNKAYGLEFSNRFGYPFLNLQQEMMKSSWKDLIDGCVKGKQNFLESNPRWAEVLVVQVPPFPFETTKDENNAKGQRIYFLNNGKFEGKDSLTTEKMKHIHFYEVKYDKTDKEFLCSGDTGYLMTVTGQLQSDVSDVKQGIKTLNENTLKYIFQNIFTSNMDVRNDIGINQRTMDCINFMMRGSWL